MKTFKELIDEAKSFHPYDDWGVLTDEDGFISGNNHPTARIHLDLVSHLTQRQYKHAVTYAQEGDTLNLRTGTKRGIELAIKNFTRFPHTESRKVRFDHTPVSPREWNQTTSIEGRPHEVLAHMKKVAGVKGDMITEAMHHASHVGEWGAITDSGELIDGRTHPTAKSHVQLGGIHPVEYFQDHMSDEHEEGALCIRTRSVKGLKLAIAHFNKLPHYKHGAVVHEHEHEEDFGYYSDGSSGKRYSVLNHMKELHAKLDDGK